MIFTPSPSQTIAISHKDGPLLVLAGPGSGKTAVITARVAHLIEHLKVPPEQILIITFTKAAAHELYMRICNNHNPDFHRITVRTFHSFFFQILQHTYGKSLPTIISTNQQYKVIRELLDKNRIFPSNNLVTKDYLTAISKRKSEIAPIYTKDQFPKTNVNTSKIQNITNAAPTYSDDLISCIHTQYEQRLWALQKMDMDDLQLKTYHLLQRNPSLCKFWQEQFSYVMIDEYQDISDIQFQCMHLLFGQMQNLFVVGDDDQAIYGFRGAKPQIMLNFLKHYPKGNKVLLETNYRCSKTIVESALNLINHNKERFKKELLPFHKNWSEPIVLKEFPSHMEQLNYLIDYAKQFIEEQIMEKQFIEKQTTKGLSVDVNSAYIKKELAILYRNNRQILGLIDLFTLFKIPFYSKEVLPSIHSHWIVQELLSTIELATDHTKFEKIRWFKDTKSKAQWEKHLNMIQTMPPYGGVMYIRKAMGYEQYLTDYAHKTYIQPKEYMEILDSFTSCIQNMNSWTDYKNYLSLQKKNQEKSKNNRNGIFLSTMHGAKGLEFDEVCILDVNEGITPYKKAGLIENLEEERRLFYVAMTRAKRKLQLLYVNNPQQSLQPSRFLYEAFQTRNLHQPNQLFTSNSSSLTNSSYSLASNHSSKASATTSYSSSSSMLSKTGSSSSFSE